MTVSTIRVPTKTWEQFRKAAGARLKSANTALTEAVELWLSQNPPPDGEYISGGSPADRNTDCS